MTQLPYHTPGIVGFRDRSTTLIATGILLILMGCFAACLGVGAPLALLAPGPSARPPLGQVIAGITFYIVLAAAFISIGIGSVRKLRWVRPLILALASIWLAIGTLSMLVLLLAMRDMGRIMAAAIPPGAPKPSPAVMTLIMTFMGVFSGIVYVIIPLVLILLYKSPDVRSTAQHYDPVPRWIEGIPIPLIALGALMLLTSLSMLMSLPYGIVPLFGTVISGPAAAIALLVLALLFATAGTLTLLLRPSGWTLALVLLIILPISFTITLMRSELFDLYAMAGVNHDQLEVLRSMRFLNRPFVMTSVAIITLILITFVMWTRRFFSQAPVLATAHGP
jgi:hypothetical protein